MNAPKSDPEILKDLRELRRSPPPDFAKRVMDALPAAPDLPLGRRLRGHWPDRNRWFLPALAGAAAMVAIMTLLAPRTAPPADSRITVHFEIHAPAAQSVELVGTFTDWQAGRLRLAGPDASGHWTTEVDLPTGRYEYGFLVDGQHWVADPNADIRRDDGFGRENAVIEL